ncbi:MULTISPECIES: LysR family transcriptional regulator [Streptomyces]|uniref:LysR family transcriptional regulator n=1 Tax=Streptomyces TaxID=1883 RepID=UPI000F658A70|nr:LysR family transcriptional regulator [Streptomyces alboflavus]
MSHRADLGTLRSFLAVYRSGGVAKAADTLGLSQPAVSRHVKALERLAGRALFERSGRGIAPTEDAHLLANRIAGHLDALDGALDAMAPGAADDSATPVLLGAPADLLEAHVLPRLAPLLATGARRIHCRIGLSPELTEALLQDELDLAVVTKIEGAPTRSLYLRHLCDEEFVLIGRPGEPPYGGPRDARPFVGYSRAMPMARRYFRSCWDTLPPEPALTIADMRAAVAAIRAGAGLGVVPRYLAQTGLDAGDLAILHTPERAVGNAIYLAARRGRERLPRVQAVFELLCQAVPAQTAGVRSDQGAASSSWAASRNRVSSRP